MEVGMNKFIKIFEVEKSVTLCSGGNKKASEKLFIPIAQKVLYEKLTHKKETWKQLEFMF